MGKYYFLPHTADEKFEVLADDLEDAFKTSVDAFYEILLGKQFRRSRTVSRKIVLRAKKLRTLLYDFLNELVFYFDDEDLLLFIVEDLIIRKETTDDPEIIDWVLEAKLNGDKTSDYELLTEIKNITYSEMEIVQNAEGVRLVVVVDI